MYVKSIRIRFMGFLFCSFLFMKEESVGKILFEFDLWVLFLFFFDNRFLGFLFCLFLLMKEEDVGRIQFE